MSETTPAPADPAPAANPERGEHEITLGGRKYLLRPSHTAIVGIERQTRPMLSLIRLGNACELSLEQLGIIAAEFIRAGATDEMTRSVDPQRISELIYEAGVPGITSRLTLVLLDAASGGRDAGGNVKAATA
jgi:hypothetical protein